MMLAVVGMVLIGTTPWYGGSTSLAGAVLLAYSMYLLRDQKRTRNLMYSTALLLMGILLVTLVLLAVSGPKGRAMWPIGLLGVVLGVGCGVSGGRGLWRAWRRWKVRNRVG